MQIDASFGAGVSAQAQRVINAVVNEFDRLFADPIVVNVSFDFGAVPTSLPAYASYTTTAFTYSQVRDALTADQTTTADNTAVASLPAADPLNAAPHTYNLTRAEQKALGLLSGTNAATDGSVTFSSGVSYDYDRSDGIAAGTYDFAAVVERGLSEVLGRTLFGGQAGFNNPADAYSLLDLFHYASPGVRTFSGTTAGYFSIDNGATNLGNFNTIPTEPFANWVGSVNQDAFDAFPQTGVVNNLSINDLRLMDVIGYNLQPDDYAGSVITTANLATPQPGAGVSVLISGNIEVSGDHDWFRVFLNAGTTYKLYYNEGNLYSPEFLAVRDRNGASLPYHHDDSPSRSVIVTPTESDYYYVDVGISEIGSYTIDLLADDYSNATSTSGIIIPGARQPAHLISAATAIGSVCNSPQGIATL